MLREALDSLKLDIIEIVVSSDNKEYMEKNK
jgi:hypothetical protein